MASRPLVRASEGTGGLGDDKGILVDSGWHGVEAERPKVCRQGRCLAKGGGQGDVLRRSREGRHQTHRWKLLALDRLLSGMPLDSGAMENTQAHPREDFGVRAEDSGKPAVPPFPPYNAQLNASHDGLSSQNKKTNASLHPPPI